MVGTAGGIASLISYPALLLVGVPPLAANATNNVAMAAMWPGASLASRSELAGTGPLLRRYGPPLAAAGAAGALLLLSTPPGLFADVVPALVLVSVAALAAEPWLTRRRAGTGRPWSLGVLLAAIGVYAGYFGAGASVMLLSCVLLLVDQRLLHANALKNLLVGISATPPAIIFLIDGPVRWSAAVPLVVGAALGSRLGPTATRRLPSRLIRGVIIALGVVLAVELAVGT